MIFRIFSSLIFLAIIAGSFWLSGQQREATATTTVEPMSADLGYSARNAVLTETGPDGAPMYTLNADLIRQRPGNGVDFDRVRMTFRDTNGQIWNARADAATLVPESGKVDLRGDVHVDGTLPGSQLQTDLATEILSVDTQQDIINTDEAVAVSSPGRQLKAHGLQAAMKEHRLILKSNVHGQFTP